jgi:hypothetical protein
MASASVRDEVHHLTRLLKAKRAKLLDDVREVERILSLIEYLDSDNHKLRKHIQAMNRHQRGDGSQGVKRSRSPNFSDDLEGVITEI